MRQRQYDVARWRSDEFCDFVFCLKFAHVNANEGIFVAFAQILCNLEMGGAYVSETYAAPNHSTATHMAGNLLGQLRLSNTRGAQEEKHQRPLFIIPAIFFAANGGRNGHYRTVLTHQRFFENLFQWN